MEVSFYIPSLTCGSFKPPVAAATTNSDSCQRGLNQTAFATPLGLTQSALSALETGRSPLRVMAALAIETVYGVRHQWLLFGTGSKVRKRRLGKSALCLLELYLNAEPQLAWSSAVMDWIPYNYIVTSVYYVLLIICG